MLRRVRPIFRAQSNDTAQCKGASTMSIDVKVYDNGDHTCVVWLPSDEQAIPNCLGFTIRRLLKADANSPATESYLHGFVGFSDTDKLDPNATWKWPVQRFMW